VLENPGKIEKGEGTPDQVEIQACAQGRKGRKGLKFKKSDKGAREGTGV